MKATEAYIAPGLVKRKLFLEEAAEIILKEMNSSLAEIRQKTRKREIRHKRQILQHLLRWYGFTLYSIGNITFRHHATVNSSFKVIEYDMLTDPFLKEFILRMKHTKLRK